MENKYKIMMIPTPEDLKELERLSKLTTANGTDKASAVNLCERYHLRGCAICKTCDAQVRILFEKIKNYYYGQK